MEIITLGQLTEETVMDVVTSVNLKLAGPQENMSSFSGQPTKVLFFPEIMFPASMHYMHFPPGSTQPFHHHPGGRHLIIIGDVDIAIRYCSTPEVLNPGQDAKLKNLPRLHIGLVRFPGRMLHSFSAEMNGSVGAVAISFHDNDGLRSGNPHLMEQLTIFWQRPEKIESGANA